MNFTTNNEHHLRGTGWKKVFQGNRPKKQAGAAILIFDKTDFKPELIGRDREGHYIHIRGKSTMRILQL